MIIHNLKVNNFRCHDQFDVNITSNKLAIIGKNGCGKTSLLEAIYLLLRGKSFKTKLANLTKSDKDWYRVIGKFNINETESLRDLKYKDDKKVFEINHQKNAKLLNKFKYPIVLFEPSDLALISGSPTRRRDFINELINQYDLEYSIYLRKYEKALKQRNNLLKNNEFLTQDDLFSWNILLSKYGSYIISRRLEAIQEINESLSKIYFEITGVKDKIELKYSHEYNGNIEQQLFNQLSKNNSITTLYGPHRHDLIFSFNDSPANQFISRGETRGIILSLKIIESEMIKNHLGLTPLILLDDVLSELDKNRQNFLMEYINDFQVILTTTDAYKLKDYQIIEIK